jgi:hypothetical protein
MNNENPVRRALRVSARYMDFLKKNKEAAV